MNQNVLGGMFSSLGLNNTGGSTAKMAIKNYSASVKITNQSNANMCVWIYDVEHRRDVVYGADSITPLSAWQQGLSSSAAGTGSTTTTVNTVGITPFQSPDFCRNYRVVKVTKIYLALGKAHSHTLILNRPKIVNGRMLDNSGAQTGAYRGITHDMLFVFQGLPVNDGTTNSLIALGSGAVDMVIQHKVTWNYVDLGGEKRYYTDDNQGTITTEKFMNEETGAADTYEEA